MQQHFGYHFHWEIEYYYFKARQKINKKKKHRDKSTKAKQTNRKKATFKDNKLEKNKM